MGDDTWGFAPDHELYESDEYVDMAWDLLESGNASEAEDILRSILDKCPHHLDAMHHLAIIVDEGGRDEEAFDLWSKAVDLGRDAFPKEFERGKDTLPWVITENRPFLRCLQGMARSYGCRGDCFGFIDTLEWLIDLNPNDNQGAREALMHIYFESELHDRALDLAEQYEDDVTPGILFGYPLLLLKKGMVSKARQRLKKAVIAQPRIARELLKKKHRKPSGFDINEVTYGSWDLAYAYWKEYGGFWSKAETGVLQEVADDVGLDRLLKEHASYEKTVRTYEKATQRGPDPREDKVLKAAPVGWKGFDDFCNIYEVDGDEEDIIEYINELMKLGKSVTERKFEPYWKACLEEGGNDMDREELARSFFSLGALSALVPVFGLGLDDFDIGRINELLERT